MGEQPTALLHACPYNAARMPLTTLQPRPQWGTGARTHATVSHLRRDRRRRGGNEEAAVNLADGFSQRVRRHEEGVKRDLWRGGWGMRVTEGMGGAA